MTNLNILIKFQNMSLSVKNKVLLELSIRGYTINKEGNVYNPKGLIINGFCDKNNYLNIGIRLKGYKCTKHVGVHRFQAFVKYGEKIFNKGIVVRHLNGNSKDNSWSNISLGTHSDNMNDMPKDIRMSKSIKAARVRQDNIRSISERKAIYADLFFGVPYNLIMNKYNITSKGTLSYMKNKSIEYKIFTQCI